MGNMKLKPFAKITERERENLEYMTAMRDVYEKTVEDYEDNDDWRKIDNVVFKLEKKIEEEDAKAAAEAEKKAEAERKLAEKKAAEDEKATVKSTEIQEKLSMKLVEKKQAEAQMEKMVDYYETVIRGMEIYHIAADNKIHTYYEDGDKWETCSKDSNHSHMGLLDSASQRAFGQALVNCGRNKTNAVYSFKKQPARVLNKMSREDWLKPDMEGYNNYNNVFDIMLLAMSDGRMEIMEHIEQVMYWKYMHPEDYMIPCLSIYGVGGLAKNTFVLYVGGAIFGENQVISLSFNDLKDFSGLLVGKTFVFLDELISDDNAANKLKLLCGNPTVTVNNKGGAQQVIESTAMWMTGGNDRMGSFLLDGTDADRRWSIIKSKRNVKYWTKELFELETKDEVKRKLAEMMDVLKDKAEVAKWLGHICTKWAGMDMCPDAWHDADYDHLLDLQKNAFDDFMESVFMDDGFTWVKRQTLFKAYSLFIGEFYEGQKRWMKGRNKFFGEVGEWLEDKNLGIVKKKVRFEDGGFDHQAWAYVPENMLSEFQNTDEKYVQKNDYGKEKLNLATFYDDSSHLVDYDDNVVGMFKKGMTTNI